jgi:hypothetical protein
VSRHRRGGWRSPTMRDSGGHQDRYGLQRLDRIFKMNEQVISEHVLLKRALTCEDFVPPRACARAPTRAGPRSRVRARAVHELSLGYGELSRSRACARARLRA